MRRREPRKTCAVCHAPITGKRSKFCSRLCHNRHGNTKHQVYQCQQRRGLLRKIRLINMLGGYCVKCGYSANYAALSFHHRDPTQKSFALDARSCSNRKWQKLVTEARKCQLLCLRCHAELHHPFLFIEHVHRRVGRTIEIQQALSNPIRLIAQFTGLAEAEILPLLQRIAHNWKIQP